MNGPWEEQPPSATCRRTSSVVNNASAPEEGARANSCLADCGDDLRGEPRVSLQEFDPIAL